MRFGSKLQRLMLMRGAGETLKSLIAQMNVTKCTKWPPPNGNGVRFFFLLQLISVASTCRRCRAPFRLMRLPCWWHLEWLFLCKQPRVAPVCTSNQSHLLPMISVDKTCRLSYIFVSLLLKPSVFTWFADLF